MTFKLKKFFYHSLCASLVLMPAAALSSQLIYNHVPNQSAGYYGWTSYGRGWMNDVWRVYTPLTTTSNLNITRISMLGWAISNDPTKMVTPADVASSFEIALWKDGASVGAPNKPSMQLQGYTKLPMSSSSIQVNGGWYYGGGWSLFRLDFFLGPDALKQFTMPGYLPKNQQTWLSVSAVGNWSKGSFAVFTGDPSVNPGRSYQNYFGQNPTDWYNFMYQRAPVAMTVWGDPVPEPATLAMLGLGALAVVRRRRKLG